MRSQSRRRGSTAALVLAGLMVLGPVGGGVAQAIDCEGLQRRIAALNRQGGGQATRYARAVRRQQAELDRTVAYRNSLGCDRQQFLMFGSPPPPDCARIDGRIEQMNANLASLQESAARLDGGDSSERGELLQRYEVYCRSPGGDYAQRGYPEDGPPGEGFRRVPLEPQDANADANDGDNPRGNPAPPEPDAPDGNTVIGGAKAVCVKTCDGAFFPVSFSASQANFSSLEALCHASCPNAETTLYTYSVASEIDKAVDKEGKTYAELPKANRFSKIYDASCSCRAPGKSWLDTLAEAERLYAGGKHDIVVTQQMSDALARPAPPTAAKKGPRSRKAGATTETAQAGPPPGAAPPEQDADAAPGLRGTGEAGAPDATAGAKRRVRVIAPNL